MGKERSQVRRRWTVEGPHSQRGSKTNNQRCDISIWLTFCTIIRDSTHLNSSKRGRHNLTEQTKGAPAYLCCKQMQAKIISLRSTDEKRTASERMHRICWRMKQWPGSWKTIMRTSKQCHSLNWPATAHQMHSLTKLQGLGLPSISRIPGSRTLPQKASPILRKGCMMPFECLEMELPKIRQTNSNCSSRIMSGIASESPISNPSRKLRKVFSAPKLVII